MLTIKYLYPAALVIISIAVYFPSLGNDFMSLWDDQWVVMNHYTESGFTWENFWAIMTEFYNGQYAPFNELLYMSLHSMFGYDAFAFHLAGLLLHIANVCLVYFCVSKLLEISHIQKRMTVSFLTALIFAVHPVNVESVAWMSASKVLVYAFFYLSATYTFLLYLQTKRVHYYIITLLLFFASFLGKEQAVTFPLWILLIYVITGHSLKDKKIWRQTAPFLILALVEGIITMISQSDDGTVHFEGYPVWQRIVYACYTLIEYFVKTVAPFKLSYLYPFPSQPDDPLPLWLLIYPALIAIMLFGLGTWIYKHKPLFFSLLFFTIHIAVALHLISLDRFAVVADRYVYVSSIGIAFVISWYVVKYIYVKKYAKIMFTCMLTYVIYLGWYANIRTHTWHDSDTLKKEIRDLLKQRNDYQNKHVIDFK
ncbi:MAG: glycosyltransferase family 39 protein [Tannerella sp.]|jgi:hypothetical protein|nr:glycosyltransferase family 39 protein [Tannerella sp.]